MKTAIVTDQKQKVFSARYEPSLRGLHVDKILVIISRDFKMADDVKRNLKMAVGRSQGTIEYIYTD
jgi:hypothetical protein